MPSLRYARYGQGTRPGRIDVRATSAWPSHAGATLRYEEYGNAWACRRQAASMCVYGPAGLPCRAQPGCQGGHAVRAV